MSQSSLSAAVFQRRTRCRCSSGNGHVLNIDPAILQAAAQSQHASFDACELYLCTHELTAISHNEGSQQSGNHMAGATLSKGPTSSSQARDLL